MKMETCMQQLNYHTTKRQRLDSPPPKKRLRSETTKASRDLDEFEMLNKIGEGTYGVVYRARDSKTKQIVAVKKLKTDNKQSNQEADILTSLHHPSIINLNHVLAGSHAGSHAGSTFMVMEYAENDLRSLLEANNKQPPFSLGEIKCLMQQLLQGVAYLHRSQVIHRDLKTSNLLFNNCGELKICDFGLACKFEKNRMPHTETVVSLWYRAPELLLGAEEYSTAIDMWSVGCVMAELLSGEALFAGATEIDQLGKIIGILGSPTEAIWAGFSKLRGVKGLVKVGNFVRNRCSLLRRRFPAVSFTARPVVSGAGFDLLSGLLRYDPEKRMSAEEAVDHAWFREVPLPRCKELMPTFNANCGVVKKVEEPIDSGSLGLFGL